VWNHGQMISGEVVNNAIYGNPTASSCKACGRRSHGRDTKFKGQPSSATCPERMVRRAKLDLARQVQVEERPFRAAL